MWSDKGIEKALRTKAYLRGKTLRWETYQPTYPAEHTFCAFCWSRISSFEEDFHEGYHEVETDSWACEECFSFFAEKLELTPDDSQKTELRWEDIVSRESFDFILF